jgi:hypothetical protein
MDELDVKLMQRLMQVEDQPKPRLLHEANGCAIVDCGVSTRLWLRGSWRSEFAELARSFKVDDVWAYGDDGWNGDSIEFLCGLEALRSVSIGASRKLDWAPLERLASLESLDISSLEGEQERLDFVRLPRLRKCSVRPWRPEFDSVRNCPWLRSLRVRDTQFLRELDLSQLVDLEELLLYQCSRLRLVHVAGTARIRSLQISCCPRLRFDFRRFAKDLESLCLEGRQNYSLAELGLAVNLKKLMLVGVAGASPLPEFLHGLSSLRELVSIGTQLSESDQRIVAATPAWRRST